MKINIELETSNLLDIQRKFVEALSEEELQQYIIHLMNKQSDIDLIIGLLLDIREEVFDKSKKMSVSKEFNNLNEEVYNNNNSIEEICDNNNSNIEVIKLEHTSENVNSNTEDILKRIKKMKGGKK